MATKYAQKIPPRLCSKQSEKMYASIALALFDKIKSITTYNIQINAKI